MQKQRQSREGLQLRLLSLAASVSSCGQSLSTPIVSSATWILTKLVSKAMLDMRSKLSCRHFLAALWPSANRCTDAKTFCQYTCRCLAIVSASSLPLVQAQSFLISSNSISKLSCGQQQMTLSKSSAIDNAMYYVE